MSTHTAAHPLRHRLALRLGLAVATVAAAGAVSVGTADQAQAASYRVHTVSSQYGKTSAATSCQTVQNMYRNAGATIVRYCHYTGYVYSGFNNIWVHQYQFYYRQGV